MKNLINLFKNKLDRTIQKKEVFVIALVIMPIVILTAVLLSGRIGLKSNLAVIADATQQLTAESFPKNDKFTIEILNKKPPLSDLLFGFYDAFVEKVGTTYVVTSEIKSKTDIKIIEDYFNLGKNPAAFESQEWERGLGTKILGFLVMILLMQAVALTSLYPEDRALKTFGRILTTPVNENQYIVTQGLFTFLWVSIPTYLAVVITKVCFNVEMGFSLEMLALLVALLSAFSTGFALFLSSVLKQNISLTASGIAIITSLAAGCMVSFSFNNNVLDLLIAIFPQKEFMTVADGIEKGKGILDFKIELAYFAVWIVGLWVLGSATIKGKVKKGAY